MNFLIDENLPASLVQSIQVFGRAWHVCALGLAGADDRTVLRTAVHKEAILITRDLEFGNPFLYPPARHRGIIIVRVPSHFDVRAIIGLVKQGLTRLADEPLDGAVVVIDPRRVRIRRPTQ